MSKHVPSASSQLQTAAVIQGINIQRVAKSLRGDVLDILVNLRDDLIAKLNSTVTITDWQRQRLTNLLRYAQKTIDTAYSTIGDKTVKDLNGVSDAALAQLTNAVNKVVGVEISTKLAPKQLESIAKTADLLIQGATQKDWWAKQSSDLQYQFTTTIQQGLLTGKSIGEMTPLVQDVMDTSQARAEALIRTAVATTQSDAQQTYYANNDDIIKGVQWVATLDSRTTPVCRAYDGLTWTYDSDQGKMEPVGHDKKWLGYPPIHWACRSTTIPVMRKWSELSDMKLAHKDDQTVQEVFEKELGDQGFSNDEIADIHQDQRASMDGQVAEAMTYEEWLKSKPEQFQQQVLGQQRWQLWQDGKVNLAQMIDGDGNPLTVAELKQAAQDNIELPLAKADENQDGITLAERAILMAQLTAGKTDGQYNTTWIDDKTGITVDQSLTHSLTAGEMDLLNQDGWGPITHLSNSLSSNEYWDVSELKTWTAVANFREAKLVLGDGRIASVKLKSGKSWTTDDVQVFQSALRGCEKRYGNRKDQVACAFKSTGKMSFAVSKIGAVQLDPSAAKLIYPLSERKRLNKR